MIHCKLTILLLALSMCLLGCSSSRDVEYHGEKQQLGGQQFFVPQDLQPSDSEQYYPIPTAKGISESSDAKKSNLLLPPDMQSAK